MRKNPAHRLLLLSVVIFTTLVYTLSPTTFVQAKSNTAFTNTLPAKEINIAMNGVYWVLVLSILIVPIILFAHNARSGNSLEKDTGSKGGKSNGGKEEVES